MTSSAIFNEIFIYDPFRNIWLNVIIVKCVENAFWLQKKLLDDHVSMG